MRILILNWRGPKNPNAGGAEIVTMIHAKAWLKKGWQVTWLSGGHEGAEKENIVDGVKIVRYGNPITIYLLAPLVYWFKYRGKFDVIIDQLHGYPFFSPLWAWRSKKIVFIHEVAKEIWDEMWPFPINLLGKLIERFMFLSYFGCQFVTVSPSTAKDVENLGVSRRRINVVLNALDIKSVDQVPKKERDLTVVFCSRLVKMKGIEDAIKVFSYVKKLVPEAVFWVIGGGETIYKEKLIELTVDLDLTDVEFLGRVSQEERNSRYQKAHFLIHTSVREGFGLVVLEANSQGTPAITYDSPGLRDIVRNGYNGYQFPRGSEQQMAGKMVELYRNKKEYQKLADSSVKEVGRYSWAKSTKQFADVIRSVVRGN